jgi:hypothetical protein
MAIDLSKKVEKVGIVLEKRKIKKDITCQVKFAIDKSGSMSDLYYNGTVQKVVEQMLAIGMTFDKDKQIDMWAFTDNSYSLPTVNEHNIENYVIKHIEKKVEYGGTSYAPVLTEIINDSKEKKGFLGFGKKPAEHTLVIFVTDGENSDISQSQKVLGNIEESSNIYWLMVGIGKSSFSFIRKMGEKLENVGFIEIKDISHMSDEALYEALLSDELASWFAKTGK